MPAFAVLAFREPSTGAFYDNLREGGVKVRFEAEDGSRHWVTLSSTNTRVMNPEHDPDKHSADDPVYPRWITPI